MQKKLFHHKQVERDMWTSNTTCSQHDLTQNFPPNLGKKQPFLHPSIHLFSIQPRTFVSKFKCCDFLPANHPASQPAHHVTAITFRFCSPHTLPIMESQHFWLQPTCPNFYCIIVIMIAVFVVIINFLIMYRWCLQYNSEQNKNAPAT